MMAEIENAIQQELYKDQLRAAFLEFTRKAFLAIPERAKPRILDIGCGTGIPAIELAKLSRGKVTAIDIDRAKIDKLRKRIEEEGLSDQIITRHCSLFELDFPDHSFDIVWAEGVIGIIGFREGLKRWRRFITPRGYLVVHDDEQGVQEKRRLIQECGYTLLQEFCLPTVLWRERYFLPLKVGIERLSLHYKGNTAAMKLLTKEREEMEEFTKNPRGSIFFVMQCAEHPISTTRYRNIMNKETKKKTTHDKGEL
jgi:ubiquinone/menaquinone biosynthesis C-methylase UbiE